MFFKYCIWLTSKKNNIWDEYTNGFKAHMSIKTKFNYLYKAKQFFDSISDRAPIHVELIGPIINTNENGFHAAYYNIKYSNKNIQKEPEWWPKNAHVSFLYKYKIQIHESELKKVERNIEVFECIFDEIIIMKCNYHHNYWKQVY